MVLCNLEEQSHGIAIAADFRQETGGRAIRQADWGWRFSLDEKEATNSGKDVPPSPADIHGVEPTEEFKPVEHPLEPPDKDQPIKCPPPEPSILNDGRIWKERLEASVRRRAELPIIRETGMQSQRLQRRRRAISSEHLIVPSFSAPEHTILKFLDDQAAL